MQVIVAERGPLVFVFNFSPYNDYEGYKVSNHHASPVEVLANLRDVIGLAALHTSPAQGMSSGVFTDRHA